MSILRLSPWPRRWSTGREYPGLHCKNLFVRNKPGKRHYLIVAEHLKPLDLLALSHTLGDTRLSFASDERMARYLGLQPGEVSPFGLLSDEKQEVIVVLDEDVTRADSVNFHPNVNTATLTVVHSDFLKFLKWRWETAWWSSKCDSISLPDSRKSSGKVMEI